MKITMSQALAFQKFYERIKNNHCSLKTSYKLNKLDALLASEIEFFNQRFNEIVQEYAKKDEQGNFVYSADGSSIQIIDGKTGECEDKLNELQGLEIQLPDIIFSLDEFDGIDISIMELRPLIPFMDE